MGHLLFTFVPALLFFKFIHMMMEININELKEWENGARRVLEREVEHLREQERQMDNSLRLMDVTEELLAEIDNLKGSLERKQAEIDSLNGELEQKQAEMDLLRGQLLEAKEQHLEVEVNAKPAEIHNHFESGCSAQVFNDRVNGRFEKSEKLKKFKKKEKEKKRWKKIARKIL